MLAARGRFLEAIEDHASRVLTDLAGEPLALARRVPGWTCDGLNAPLSPLAWGDQFEWATICYPGHDGDPSRVALRRSLAAWGARYGFLPRPGVGLGYDWGLDNALQTLGQWIAAGDRFNPQQPTWEMTPGTAAYRPRGTLTGQRRGPGIGRAVEAVLAPSETQITFPEIHWNPQTETRAAFKARQIERFKEHLDSALNDIEDIGKTRLIEAERVMSDEPFVWLVWYQVEGLSFGDIAERISTERPDGIEEASVSQAVTKAAGLATIDYRRGKRGPKARLR